MARAPQANKSTDYKFSLVWAVVSLRADAAPYNKYRKQNETSKTSLPPDCRSRIRLIFSHRASRFLILPLQNNHIFLSNILILLGIYEYFTDFLSLLILY